MRQLQVFQEQENTVKAEAFFLTAKRSWEHRQEQAPRAFLGSLWGKPFSVAEEGTRALSTWLSAKYGDGWGLPCGIERKMEEEVGTLMMHS